MTIFFSKGKKKKKRENEVMKGKETNGEDENDFFFQVDTTVTRKESMVSWRKKNCVLRP